MVVKWPWCGHITGVRAPAPARRGFLLHGIIEGRRGGVGGRFPRREAAQRPSGALGGPRGFARRGPGGHGQLLAFFAAHHDLFEQVNRRRSDGPGEPELAQMRAGVARQGFAGLEQLAAEIAEDRRWLGLDICGTAGKHKEDESALW